MSQSDDTRALHAQASAGDGLAVVKAAARDLETLSKKDLAAGLYIVATPIGNLGDITLRALAVLASADAIYCEDTRHSRILLDHFSIKTPLRPYHEHNAEAKRPEIIGGLEDGKRIALISDAGTPLVSDPGYKLVRAAVEAGHQVISIPGASAVLTALTSSGLPSDAVLFAGFLPVKRTQRRRRLQVLAGLEATLIFFEASQRVADTLQDAFEEFGERPASLARELTKMHETLVRDTLSGLAKTIGKETLKGECVIVIGGAVQSDACDAEILSRLESLLETHSVKDASRLVSEELNAAKGRVYDLALSLKSSR